MNDVTVAGPTGNSMTRIIVIAVIILGLGGYFFLSKKNADAPIQEPVGQTQEKNLSRVWMEYAQDIVREKKPTPPASARFYAYVASVYDEVLGATNNTETASIATAEIINFLYTDKVASSTAVMEKMNVTSAQLTGDASGVVEKYKARHTQDTKQAVEPVRPTGVEYWVGEDPFEPSAGSWQRWVVGTEKFEVALPPVFGSKEYNNALVEVKNAAAMRTTEQGAKINFWGGVPGTEAPAGIWQNRLFNVTKELALTDAEYSHAQMVLAQSLADSFMECWKVKYTYWTKRPSMADPTIDLAMNNPKFPSYTSGHSTISATAATVLGVLFPEYKDTWHTDAVEAKNSRLWAGIHFSYDNEEGFKLGERIGARVIENLKLEKVK